ncbi:UNVERIFIED_CONTAM: hypothetical protein Sradi_4099400 [Sesamum radiatum]|uniref:Uncharacterized protein n=1 Tax=Sesamum radiatum TaxID=300843 RepID=A0AAW2P073_SESRA
MVNAPNPFANPPTPSSGNLPPESENSVEEDLDSILGEVEEEVKNTPPPKAAIDSVVGEVPSEGIPVLKEGGTSVEASKEPSNAPADAPIETPTEVSESQIEKEDPTSGEQK